MIGGYWRCKSLAGETMISSGFRRHLFIAGLVVGLIVMAAPTLCFAQEAGGDLGGGAGVFRPKNPLAKNKKNTKTTTAKAAALLAEKVEAALEEGNTARDARKFDGAERAYSSAVQLKTTEARAYQGLGNIFTDQERWVDADNNYRLAIRYDPNGADSYIALSYVLIQPRSDGSSAKRLADAEAMARRAVSLQPLNPYAHDRLGAALESRGIRGIDTEQAYRKAVELEPNFAVACLHLARFLRRAGKEPEAATYYKRATELAKDAPTLVLIAESLQFDQRWDEAEALLRKALDLDARNPQALFMLGRSNVIQEKYNEAEPLLKSAIEVSPKSFSPYYVLGSAYIRLNRLEDAEATDNRAATFASVGEKKLLAGLFGLSGVGDAYLKAGRVKDAVRAYETALRLDPGNQVIETKLNDARAKPVR
jgi:tetratricopeptide (TPR) repeat protein